MDLQRMKQVDRLAGYPLCGALRVYDLLRGGNSRAAKLGGSEPPPPVELGPRPRIAVVKFWGMGSLILAAPMFYALRRSYPHAEVHLITLDHNRAILELLDLADQAHFLTLPAEAAGVAKSILAFFGRLKRLQPDAVIDLEYLTRFSAVASYLTGAPIRVGFHSWDVWRGGLHNMRRAFNPYWHATQNFMNLQAALTGRDSGPEPVKLKLDGSEDEEARALLQSERVAPGERLIAVNPNASTIALARRWPERHFVELIDRMVERGLGRVALLGAKDEAEFVAGLQVRTRRPEAVVNLAGKSSLRGLAGILKAAALLITNDSGPLHLAGALGTPTVSFFGPETPLLYGPRGPRNIVLHRDIDCSPCINIYNAKTVRCMRTEPECLTRISVDEALAAAEKALGEK